MHLKSPSLRHQSLVTLGLILDLQFLLLSVRIGHHMRPRSLCGVRIVQAIDKRVYIAGRLSRPLV